MKEVYLEVDLTDPLWDEKSGHPKTIKAKIDITDSGIWIGAEGHGELGATVGDGFPILIELTKGALRVALWKDINDSEPIFISMAGALETNRREE